MPNTEQGLLRSLLYQITSALPLERDVLSKYELTLEHILSSQESEKLIDILASLVKSEKLNVLFFVDGLDEYEHDIVKLIDLLEMIRSRTQLRLCLASRPESIIQTKLARFPTVKVQNYNATGIESYVRATISEICGHIDASDTSFSLEGSIKYIISKAEGVFLWVHFAVSTLIERHVIGCVEQEVMDALRSLPTQLDEMYDRIFEQTPEVCKPEAAMVLMLIQSASHIIDLGLLRAAWLYLHHISGNTTLQLKHLTVMQFAIRLRGFLGGLLDLEQPTDQDSDGEASASKQTVRLVHETLRAYMRKRSLVDRWAHTNVKEGYAENTWIKVYAQALTYAKETFVTRQWDLIREVETRYQHARLKELHPENAAREVFDKQIDKEKTTLSETNQELQLIALDLLPYSLLNLEIVAIGVEPIDEVSKLCSEALQTPLVLLCDTLQVKHRQVGRPMRYHDQDGIYDLVYAAAKSWVTYVQKHSKRLEQLSATQRRYLFVCACGGSMTFDISGTPVYMFRPLRNRAVPILQALLLSEPALDNVYVAFVMQSHLPQGTPKLVKTIRSARASSANMTQITDIRVAGTAWSSFVHSLWHVKSFEFVECITTNNIPYDMAKMWLELLEKEGLDFKTWKDRSGNNVIHLILRGSNAYAKRTTLLQSTVVDDNAANTIELIRYSQGRGAIFPTALDSEDTAYMELIRLNKNIIWKVSTGPYLGSQLLMWKAFQADVTEWLNLSTSQSQVTRASRDPEQDNTTTSKQATEIAQTTEPSPEPQIVSNASVSQQRPEESIGPNKPPHGRRSRLLGAFRHLRIKSLE